MRRHRVVMVLAGAAAVWCAAPLAVTAAPAAGAVARAGTWRTAIEVPGLGSLNTGGNAQLASVSCGSAGNCAAVGRYRDSSGHGQAFVVSERNGTWGPAAEVSGPGLLTAGGGAESVSCASAGNCVAGGYYADGPGPFRVFVVSERNGTWGQAVEVGPGILNVFPAGGEASVTSVSCATAGNCAVVGDYLDSSDRFQVFVVNERNGTWGQAAEVPGLGSLNAGGFAAVFSVSCARAGNCAAGGFYTDSSGHGQAFVVGEKDGTWGNAIEVPGSGSLNAAGDASVDSLSCATPGNCAAGGDYRDGSGNVQALVVSEKDGTWGKAIEVPGSGTLNFDGDANVTSASCAAAGNCAAGGTYTDGLGRQQAFVVNERNGTWGKAIEVPGSGTLNAAGNPSVGSVSCATAGNCAAGGSYADTLGRQQAFVVNERNGTWGQAIEVPGTGALNAGGSAAVNSVSCRTAGKCAAGGTYTDGSGRIQGFVVSQP